MRSLKGMLLLVDRTAALFVGLGVGAVVAFSFGGGDTVSDAQASIPPAPGSRTEAAPAAAAPRPQVEPVGARLAAAAAEGR